MKETIHGTAFGVYEFAFGITKDHVTTATYPRRCMVLGPFAHIPAAWEKEFCCMESGMGGVVVSAPARSIIVASIHF